MAGNNNNINLNASGYSGYLQGDYSINQSDYNLNDLAKAAAEIQQLLEQLELIQPTFTTAEKMAVATEAIKYIESHPTLKARLFNALKLGSAQALEEAINHPTARFVIAALEDWQKLDSQKYGSSSDIELGFLTEVLQAIQDSNGNSQVVYPILQANLDKLNDSLTQKLHLWVTTILPRLPRSQVQRAAANIANYGTFVEINPLLHQRLNLDLQRHLFE